MQKKTKGLIAGILLLSGVFAFGNGQQADNKAENNTPISAENKAPFSRGVHFAQWFDSIQSAQGINLRRYTEQDFIDVKNLGADAIRLPIDFDVLTSPAPDYTIDPLFFKLLDQAVDLAEKYQLYIIPNHHPHGQPPTDVKVRDFLIPVWTQMAQRYKDRSQYFIYEIHNEVNHITSENWGKIQGDVIDAIRKIDTQHWIVVTGADNDDGYSSVSTLADLPKYADKKLIYTFHYYLPMIFSHQGAGHLPELKQVAGVPFPYDKNRMPPLPNQLKGSWIEYKFNDYPKDGTAEALTKKIDLAANFSKQRNVPVFCSEFGVFKWVAPPEDRVKWYRIVREAFEARNIAWTIYGYYDDLGLFNTPYGGDINTDLNVELVKALGFTPVPQKQREPLKSGFTIYDDYLGRGFRTSLWNETMQLNLFYTPAAEGEYALHWKDSAKSALQIDLNNYDFTYLVQNGFFIEFKIKSENLTSLNIMFGNNKDNITWMNQISNVKIRPDGKWQTVRIPLNTIKECYGGSEDVTYKWIETQGRPVSWDNVTRIQFAPRDGATELYLDDIKITK